MFPSLMVRPETTMASYWLIYLVLTFGFLLRQYKKIIAVLMICAILFIPQQSHSFGAVPGACGTSCMAMWGRTQYPSVYYSPWMFDPYSFYANQMSYFSMLPPWYAQSAMPMVPAMRGIQSTDK